MKNIDLASIQRPTAAQLEIEILRVRRRRDIRKSIISTLCVLVVISAAVFLVLTLWLPVLQVQRSSMSPTLSDGEVIVFVTTAKIERGDIIAFYQGNQVLVKRVVAVYGDLVEIDEYGEVTLNGSLLDEPYVSSYSSAGSVHGDDKEFSVLVSENSFFVLGDHRQTSIDSRNSEIGLVHSDRVIGRALFRLWPPDKIGSVR